MRWCGPEVEVEGIVSVKTGGCPEDCHFCAQSGRFASPVRSVWLDIDDLVASARATAATGATEFCIVAAVRGPDERLMSQVRTGIAAIRAAVSINIACSLGMLTPDQAAELAAMGVHRYNHNLETARSHFASVVTTHTWEERFATCELVRSHGMELCCGAHHRHGRDAAAAGRACGRACRPGPDEVPLNFLNPRPGTPLRRLSPRGRQASAEDDRRVQARAAAHGPALRGRARTHARGPGHARGHTWRHQRDHRRQLPDDSRPPCPGDWTCSPS